MSARGSSRSGFTAIEMMIVLGVMIALSSMAVPALMPALRRARVNDAANAIVTAHADARRLALSAPSSIVYGVRIAEKNIDGQGRQVIALLRGGSVIDNSERLINPSVLIQGTTQWYYESGTGYPTTSSSGNGMDNIPLTVRSVDKSPQGKFRTAVMIYAIGIGHAQDM